ncbi:MAG: hypothetical protein IPM29_18420 [Planctomycetes bacterium]|nr:hypothetical protein [Planctomycetota bacterium]
MTVLVIEDAGSPVPIELPLPSTTGALVSLPFAADRAAMTLGPFALPPCTVDTICVEVADGALGARSNWVRAELRGDRLVEAPADAAGPAGAPGEAAIAVMRG